MAEETVTVGDTEVTITETEDGFEVEEVEEEPDEGLYIRASCGGDDYGFEVPLGANLEIVSSGSVYHAAWDTDEDVSDLRNDGLSDSKVTSVERDGNASVQKPEIIER